MLQRDLVLLVVVLGSLAGCREPRLEDSRGDVRFRQTSLSFEPTFIGGVREQLVEIENVGRIPYTLTWTGPEAPFEVDPLPTEIQPGTRSILIRFRPKEFSAYDGQLTVTFDVNRKNALLMDGEGAAIPFCPSPVACHTATFDPALGRCVESQLPDGTTCDGHNKCVTGGVCQGGRCVGDPVVCEDGNACTLNTCNALKGCEFPPVPPCPGDGKCQVGVCDPQVGCGLAPAKDGSLCGSKSGCDEADVCIDGQCVTRDPPDGFVCAPASPCQGAGTCAGSVCVQPAAQPLVPTWTFNQAEKTNPAPLALHDMVLEPDGSISLSGFFTTPWFRANRPGSALATSSARRCMLWNQNMVCADYPGGLAGKVTLVELSTGKNVWTFDLTAKRPDFAALTQTGNLFMARLASMGSDRLAALFEAYPSGTVPGQPTQCRLYFLVMLDAGGHMVSAQKLDDPLLDLCNHPHPYGYTADASGNLFIAFSPSAVDGAPLVPHPPSILMGFSRDGILKWKRNEPYVAGELAVANGLIFPERSDAFHTGQTGFKSGPQALFGRGVATSEHFIHLFRPLGEASPLGNSLKAYSFPGQSAPPWAFQLPDSAQFESDQLRLAQWRSAADQPAQPVALGFAQHNQSPHLVAVKARSGELAWMCRLQYQREKPAQLFEVSNGTFAVMDNATTCGNCDPPFALSAASFAVFAAPGLEASTAPWPGTYGGPGHDHHENPTYPVVTAPSP